jgi:hypothetical protein
MRLDEIKKTQNERTHSRGVVVKRNQSNIFVINNFIIYTLLKQL